MPLRIPAADKEDPSALMTPSRASQGSDVTVVYKGSWLALDGDQKQPQKGYRGGRLAGFSENYLSYNDLA